MYKKKLQADPYLRVVYTIGFLSTSWFFLFFVVEKYLFNHALLYTLNHYFGEDQIVFNLIMFFPPKFFSSFLLIRFITVKINPPSKKQRAHSVLHTVWIALFIQVAESFHVWINHILSSSELVASLGLPGRGFVFLATFMSLIFLSNLILPAIVLTFWLKNKDVENKTFPACFRKHLHFVGSQVKPILLLITKTILLVVVVSLFFSVIAPGILMRLTNIWNVLTSGDGVARMVYNMLVVYIFSLVSFIIPSGLSKILRDFVDFLKDMENPRRKKRR